MNYEYTGPVRDVEPDGGIKGKDGMYLSALDDFGVRKIIRSMSPVTAVEHARKAVEWDEANICPKLLARNFVVGLSPGGMYEHAFEDSEIDEAVQTLLELAPLLVGK